MVKQFVRLPTMPQGKLMHDFAVTMGSNPHSEDTLGIAKVLKRMVARDGRPSPLLIRFRKLLRGNDVFEKVQTDSHGTWDFEPIFVDSQTFDFRVEHARWQT